MATALPWFQGGSEGDNWRQLGRWGPSRPLSLEGTVETEDAASVSDIQGQNDAAKARTAEATVEKSPPSKEGGYYREKPAL